jgi:hypothetical protein
VSSNPNQVIGGFELLGLIFTIAVVGYIFMKATDLFTDIKDRFKEW